MSPTCRVPCHPLRTPARKPTHPSRCPLAEVQKHHVLRTLRYTGGKKAPAARLLGIDVKTLYSKIKSYELEF